MSRAERFKYGVLVLLISVVVSCGYGFSPGGEHIDPGIQSVFVDNFVNNTPEANAETTFRSAFISRFQTSPRFKQAPSKELADAVLKAGIAGLTSTHLSYYSTNIAREDRLTVVMDVTFETKSGEVIWSNRSFSWYADYLLDQNNVAVTEANRRAALVKLATEMADRAYRAIMSGF